LRWYDAAGDWIPTNGERAGLNADRADRAEQQLLTEAEARKTAEQQLITETQARREAIPRLKALGLSAEQIAVAFGLAIVSDRPEVIGEVALLTIGFEKDCFIQKQPLQNRH
jgi:predicted transposase YdaD